MLINPLNSLPWVINGVVQAWVSVKRVQRYLDLPNLNWLDYYVFNELGTSPTNPVGDNSTILEFRNASFSWKSAPLPNGNDDTSLLDPTRTVLADVSLKIHRGQLVGVIGKVGSGKTSLLHAILAEIEKLDDTGRVRIDANICAEVI